MKEKLGKILAGVGAVAVVVALVLYFSGETKREMTPLMRQMAVSVSQTFAKDLPRRPEVNTLLVLVAGRGNREEEDQFHQMLVDDVRGSDKYRVTTWPEVQDQLEEGSWYEKFLGKSGLVPGAQPTTVAQAVPSLKYLESANVLIDGILLIRVTSFNEGPDESGLGAKIAIDADLYNHHQKKVVDQLGPLTEALDSAWDLRYMRYAMGSQSLFWRFPLWFLLCTGLPWIGIQGVRMVIRAKSNEANLGLLAILTLFDLALAWPLLFAFGAGPGVTVGMFVLLLLMGYYNYDATDYIARKLL